MYVHVREERRRGEAHGVGGWEADVVLVEAGEVDDVEGEGLHGGHGGHQGAVGGICAGGLQVQAALGAGGVKPGRLHIHSHLAQVAVGLPEPLDVGAEVVVVPATWQAAVQSFHQVRGCQ